jgi:long-chain acyl-CoA synthetase
MLNLASDTIWQCFEANAVNNPAKPALNFLGSEWTYGQMRVMCLRLAGALAAAGLGKGQAALLYLPNVPQWLISFFALQRLGVTTVAVSPLYAPNDLLYMIKDSGAETIFCDDTNFGYVSQVMPGSGIKRVVATRMCELLPWWKCFLGSAFDKIPEGRVPFGRDILSFRKLLRGSAGSALPEGLSGGDISVMLYTGGTTGVPKGVPFTSRALLENALDGKRLMAQAVPAGEGVVLQGGPLYHNLGLMNMLAQMCVVPELLILTPRVNLDAYFKIIRRHKVNLMAGVPLMFRMILDHERIDSYDLSSLKFVVSGGDVLPAETADRWKKRFGQRLFQAYGITEAGGGIAFSPPEESVPEGSCGKLLPSKHVMFVDPDTDKPVAPGEPGELLVSSENMVKGYWNKPDETKACFVEIDGRTWYRTKDILRCDAEGWLYFQDRSADMIKHKGYRVAPSEIEKALQEHPAVTAASVVGIPDDRVGERIKAFVVLRPDVKGVSSQVLQAWCRARLAPYKVPQYIEFRDMLPKSKVGKVLRRELRAEERKKLEKF